MHTWTNPCSFAISSCEGSTSCLVTNDPLEVSPLARRGDVATPVRPALTLAVAATSSRLPPRPIGRRCVVTAASDTTVASCAGAARLLRTKPQVRLMVLSISNDYLSDLHVAPQQIARWSRQQST